MGWERERMGLRWGSAWDRHGNGWGCEGERNGIGMGLECDRKGIGIIDKRFAIVIGNGIGMRLEWAGSLQYQLKELPLLNELAYKIQG